MSLWQRISPQEEQWSMVLESPYRTLAERQQALAGLADLGRLRTSDRLMVPWIQRLMRADRHPQGHPHTQVLVADLVARGEVLDEIWTDAQGVSHTALRWAVAQGQSAHVTALLEMGATADVVDARGKRWSWLHLALRSPLDRSPVHSNPGSLIEAVTIPLLAHGASPETGESLSAHLQTLTRIHPIFHAQSKVAAATVTRVLDAFLDAGVRLDWTMTSLYGEAIQRLLTIATEAQMTRMLPLLPLDAPSADGRTLRAFLAQDPRLQANLRQADLTLRPALERPRTRRRS